MSAKNVSSKKKDGGFLVRTAKAKGKLTTTVTNPISEEEILKKDRITADDVLRLTKATDSMYLLLMVSSCLLAWVPC